MPRKHKIKEPKAIGSAGHYLWLIGGGESINISELAGHLGKSPSHIGNFIHGHINISQQAITSGKWFELLKLNYPEAWKKYGEAFKKAVLQMPALPGKNRKPTGIDPVLSWEQNVGQFVAALLQKHGDEIEDVAAAARPRLLQNPEIWKRGIKGEMMAKTVYFDLLSETERAYHLLKRPPDDGFLQSQQLRAEGLKKLGRS